jgi:AraC family transcriptional activator FtrA
MVSICSGAFALAAAGLLDGRRATTHWQYADLLAQRFPLVDVTPEVLYTDDGDVLTSAGSAAGLDLCVHLVRNDFGPTIANAVARRLVIAPHREGGQAQFIEAPVVADTEDDRVTGSMTWALADLTRPITV